MKKSLRLLLIAAMVCASTGVAGAVWADISNSTAAQGNVQEGDNDSSTSQDGTAGSGDAVGGQVVGVVSSGDASVDATNRSEDVNIDTGDADANNEASTFTGLNSSSVASGLADIAFSTAGHGNIQEGDNNTDLSQTADATSGDGVGGEVIGVVTSAGGSADVVAANTTEDANVDTGDAEANNNADAFVGLNSSSSAFGLADISNSTAAQGNLQEGDNNLDGEQSANSASGDGVAGQVLGIVSAGDASVDATNRSEDVSVSSGDTEANNNADAFVGLNAGTTAAGLADITFSTAGQGNIHEGDNDGNFDQVADANSGDAVAGQVAGVVTSAGGSADLVLSNTSEDVDGDTGDGEFDNDTDLFVGLNAGTSAFF